MVFSTARLLTDCVRDLILVGLLGFAAATAITGNGLGVSILCGTLWIALNLVLLGWLLGAVTGEPKASKLFIFSLACVKIPASYLVLYWMYRAEYLDVLGLTIGLVCLMPVLVFRGLKGSQRITVDEEG